MDVIRVLHLDAAEIWGGGQSQIATLIIESSDLPIEHYLATPKHSKLWLKVRSHIKGFSHLPRSAALSPLAMKRIRDYCVRNKIQILHAHCGKSHVFAYWLKTIFMPSLRLVVHRRIPTPIRTNWLSKIKFTSPTVDHFIAVSDFIRTVLQAGGVSPERITTIRSSKKLFSSERDDKARAREDLRHMESVAKGGDFFIVAASRLVPDKGLSVLIDAFRQFVRQKPSARLLIAGEGPLESKLKLAAQDLTDRGLVSFLGFRKDVPNLLLGADIFVIPSLSEGLGSTIVEAMIARTAAIGSDVDGIPELLQDGKTGILAPPGDSGALLKAFTRLTIDTGERTRLAENGYQKAIKTCQPLIMIQKTFDIYRVLFLVKDKV